MYVFSSNRQVVVFWAVLRTFVVLGQTFCVACGCGSSHKRAARLAAACMGNVRWVGAFEHGSLQHERHGGVMWAFLLCLCLLLCVHSCLLMSILL